MIITSDKLQARQLHIDIPNDVELIAVEIKTEDVVIGNIYMPPATRTWDKNVYKKMMEDTTQAIRMLLQDPEDNNKWVILNGDFNSNIDWENMEVKSNSNMWDKNVVKFMQDFFLHQHIQYFTRKRGLEEPSILDLVFTRQKDDVNNIMYRPPAGMSDHVLLEYSFLVTYDVIIEENYKKHAKLQKWELCRTKKIFQ